MLHPSTKRLIDKLSEMTRKHRVSWTEGENATVVHDTEGYRVVLSAEPHSVLLTDGVGREIETCLPEDFVDETDGQGRPYAKFVAELYREAHRHARGTERAISTLLAGLDKMAPEPPVVSPPAVAAPLLDAPDATTDETALIESETAITAAVATLADQINAAAPTPPSSAELASPEPEAAPPVSPAPQILPAVAPEPAPEPAPAAEVVVAETVLRAAPEPLIASIPEQVTLPAPAAFAPAQVFAAEAPAPSVEVEPLAEPPGSFGTFGDFVQVAPEPLVVLPAEPDFETPSEFVADLSDVAAPKTEPAPESPPPEASEPEHRLAAPTLAQPISLSSIPFGFGLGAAQRVGAPSHPSSASTRAEPDALREPSAPALIDGTLDLPEDSLAAFDDLAAAEPYPPPAPQPDPAELPGESAASPLEPGQPRRFNPWN